MVILKNEKLLACFKKEKNYGARNGWFFINEKSNESDKCGLSKITQRWWWVQAAK